jgi:hypothetical protein
MTFLRETTYRVSASGTYFPSRSWRVALVLLAQPTLDRKQIISGSAFEPTANRELPDIRGDTDRPAQQSERRKWLHVPLLYHLDHPQLCLADGYFLPQ